MRGHHRIRLEKTPHVRLWTPAEKETVKDLFYEGYDDAEIGAKLGRSAKAVGLQRYYMRLHKAKQPCKEFHIHSAIADYYPRWYRILLREKWEEEQQTSTRS